MVLHCHMVEMMVVLVVAAAAVVVMVAPALEDSAPGNNFRKTLPGALSSNEGLLPLRIPNCHLVVVVVVMVVVMVVVVVVAPALEDSAPGNNFRKMLPGALSSNEGLDSPISSMPNANLDLNGPRWR